MNDTPASQEPKLRKKTWLKGFSPGNQAAGEGRAIGPAWLPAWLQRPRGILALAGVAGALVGALIAATTLGPSQVQAPARALVLGGKAVPAPSSAIVSPGGSVKSSATAKPASTDGSDASVVKAVGGGSKPVPDGTASSRPKDGGQAGTSSSPPAKAKKTNTPTPDKTTTSKQPPSSSTVVKPATTVSAPFVIKNAMTGQCADLPQEGWVEMNTPVSQSYCLPGSGDNQQFETVGTGSQFLIRHVKTGWCFDLLQSGARGPAANIQLSYCLPGDGDNQMWRKQTQGSGFFLVNVKSNLCLDVSNTSPNLDRMRAGQRLTIYPCSAADDHVWTFS